VERNFLSPNWFKRKVRHLIQLAIEHFGRNFFWYAGIVSVLAAGYKVTQPNIVVLSWLN